MVKIPQRLSKFITIAKKSLPYVLGVAILFAFIAQGDYMKMLSKRIDFLDPVALKFTLIDGVKDLSTPLVVEPTTGRQFIPGLKLVFPAPEHDLRIGYLNGGPEGVAQFNNEGNVDQAVGRIYNADLEQIFEYVSMAKACSRQIIISLNKTKAETEADAGIALRELSVKTLRDGRTATIFQNDACGYSADNLVKYLSQVQSF